MIIDVKVPEEEFKEAKSHKHVYGVRLVRTQTNQGSPLTVRRLYVYVVLGRQIEDRSNRANNQTKLFSGCEVRYALKDEDLDIGHYCGEIEYNLVVRVLNSSPWQY